MSSNQPSRRTVLTAGVGAIGLGIVGVSAIEFATDDDSPGAEGFTAKTVPAGSDPLVLVDADEIASSDTANGVTRTLLGAGQFDDLPDALVGMFGDESQSVIDPEAVGKMAFVGSETGDGGGAVVWADWTDDELLEVLESGGGNATPSESYRDRMMYGTDDASAAVLGDTEFALGTPEVVRTIADVWHGDADPVGGTTLDSFERTPSEATVRFSFEEIQFSCDDTTASDSDAYDAVTQVYGWVPASDDGIRLRLRVESNDATDEVAAAVRSDPGVDGDAVTVGHDADFVTVEYSPDDENSDFAGDGIETTVCAIGRSG
ncbi:hypothetical protein [Halorussus amylolyticus]|uniref:hypothetical protein n=1 Tax=Halorussus amylolyticus TaxID=1126242 RepID=UPI00104DA101|nr:hypothetical protein [Halorussus amylolyticus]